MPRLGGHLPVVGLVSEEGEEGGVLRLLQALIRIRTTSPLRVRTRSCVGDRAEATVLTRLGSSLLYVLSPRVFLFFIVYFASLLSYPQFVQLFLLTCSLFVLYSRVLVQVPISGRTILVGAS